MKMELRDDFFYKFPCPLLQNGPRAPKVSFFLQICASMRSLLTIVLTCFSLSTCLFCPKKHKRWTYFGNEICCAADLTHNLCTVCRFCRLRLAPPMPTTPARRQPKILNKLFGGAAMTRRRHLQY